MRRPIALLLCVAVLPSAPALAANEELFGSGKPPVFKEATDDKRFMRSKFVKMLDKGTEEPACVELLGGMLMVLAELAPQLHNRDENFILDPVLQAALQQQLSTAAFPAAAYLVAMVRRVLLDKRLPDTWLETAIAINKQVKIIDIARLKMLNDGVTFVDSAYFTIPVLAERYYSEVVTANSAVTTDVRATFRDTYIDRTVAWGGMTLVDTGINAAKKKKPKPGEMAELVAILAWAPPDPNAGKIIIGKVERPKPIEVQVKLQPKQYFDLEKLRKGQRVMVRGKFWQMSTDLTQLLIKDAVLFDDRDFSQGVMLGAPADIAQCPAAINEITGLAPQYGGFAH
jgi:hypothetical protein